MEEKDRSDQPLPGSVSNQNSEEAEPGHDGRDAGRRENAAGEESPSGGEAGEGSQSSGHPDSAG